MKQHENKLKLNLFLFSLVISALLLLYYSFYNYEINFNIKDIIIFLVLSTLSEVFSVNLPKYGNVSVTFAIDLAAILLLGPFFAALVGGASFIFTDLVRKDRALYKIIFNTSGIIITICLSAFTYFHFGQKSLVVEMYNIWPILLAALVYAQVNLSLFAVLFSIIKSVPFKEIWLTNINSVHANFLALIPTGIIIAYLYKNIGIWAVVFFFIPLLLARHSFKLYTEMREMYLDSISSLAATIDAKDMYTLGHSQRVSQYAVAIAKGMKLPEDEIENLTYIALLHDIGKIAVPEYLLNKPSKLSDDEYNVMKYHAEYGAEIVKKIKFLKGYEIIRNHHEHFDGSGYPDKLAGDRIPLAARIITIADSFDAMTSDRPYRKALSVKEAFLELEKYKNKQFDSKIVDLFIKVYPDIIINEPDLDKFIIPREMQTRLRSISGGVEIAL